MSGMKIVVAGNKRQSGTIIDEGKKALIFEVYKRLCEEMYKGKDEDCMFAHAFLTMEWNSIAISDNSVNMHVQHIQWRSDCLIFYFGTSKGNHTGERDNDPWRVY